MTGETASPWVSRRSASSRTPVTLLTSETNALCYTPGLKKRSGASLDQREEISLKIKSSSPKMEGILVGGFVVNKNETK